MNNSIGARVGGTSSIKVIKLECTIAKRRNIYEKYSKAGATGWITPQRLCGGGSFLLSTLPDARTQMSPRNVHAFQYIKIRASRHIHARICRRKYIQSGWLEPTVFFILVFFILKFLSFSLSSARSTMHLVDFFVDFLRVLYVRVKLYLFFMTPSRRDHLFPLRGK